MEYEPKSSSDAGLPDLLHPWGIASKEAALLQIGRLPDQIGFSDGCLKEKAIIHNAGVGPLLLSSLF